MVMTKTKHDGPLQTTRPVPHTDRYPRTLAPATATSAKKSRESLSNAYNPDRPTERTISNCATLQRNASDYPAK